MKRDKIDMLKVLTWLDHNDPFSLADVRLCCISTGLTASEDDCINCDSAEQVGALMQDKVQWQIQGGSTGSCPLPPIIRDFFSEVRFL